MRNPRAGTAWQLNWVFGGLMTCNPNTTESSSFYFPLFWVVLFGALDIIPVPCTGTGPSVRYGTNDAGGMNLASCG